MQGSAWGLALIVCAGASVSVHAQGVSPGGSPVTTHRDSVAALAMDSTILAAQHAPPLHLTRASAVALALKNNPQLAVAREQTAQFRAQKVQAAAIPDPVVTASLDGQPGFFRSAPGGQKNVGVTLDVPFPDKLRRQGQVAGADVQNAEANYVALRQQLAAQTEAAYDSLLAALRHREDLTESKTLTGDFLTKTRARFEAGTSAKLDVIKAQVDAALAENQIIANQRDIAVQRDALDRLMNRPVGTPVVPDDTLSVPPPLPSLDAMIAATLQSRPELAGLAAERQGAHSATILAREFWLPDITFGVARDLTPGAPPSQFSTGLAFPLPVLFWQHTRGEVSQAEHHERELAASQKDLTAAVLQDLGATYANASTARDQAVYLRDQLIPSAQEAYRAILASYNIGGSSAFDVIDARRTLLDALSQYTDALSAANASRADLERAAGTSLDAIASGSSHAQ